MTVNLRKEGEEITFMKEDLIVIKSSVSWKELGVGYTVIYYNHGKKGKFFILLWFIKSDPKRKIKGIWHKVRNYNERCRWKFTFSS